MKCKSLSLLKLDDVISTPFEFNVLSSSDEEEEEEGDGKVQSESEEDEKSESEEEGEEQERDKEEEGEDEIVLFTPTFPIVKKEPELSRHESCINSLPYYKTLKSSTLSGDFSLSRWKRKGTIKKKPAGLPPRFPCKHVTTPALDLPPPPPEEEEEEGEVTCLFRKISDPSPENEYVTKLRKRKRRGRKKRPRRRRLVRSKKKRVKRVLKKEEVVKRIIRKTRPAEADPLPTISPDDPRMDAYGVLWIDGIPPEITEGQKLDLQWERVLEMARNMGNYTIKKLEEEEEEELSDESN